MKGRIDWQGLVGYLAFIAACVAIASAIAGLIVAAFYLHPAAGIAATVLIFIAALLWGFYDPQGGERT